MSFVRDLLVCGSYWKIHKMLHITLYLFLFIMAFARSDYWNPVAKELHNEPLERDEIIQVVNNAKTSWQAGRNFHPALKKSYMKHLFGVTKPRRGSLSLNTLEKRSNKYAVQIDSKDLPKEFDAREKWTKCKALQEVRDQGECGSCWAMSTSSAFTDRLCIATDGKFNDILSGQDLITCVYGDKHPGCSGGLPEEAWDYMEFTGIVTGGDYNSQKGCKPYGFPGCNHYVPGRYNKTCSIDYHSPPPTPSCTKSCSNKRYKDHDYVSDTYKADGNFIIPYHYKDDGKTTIDIMKKEIFTHGPIVAIFDVYEDFVSYKSGVYQFNNEVEQNEYYYGHAVKVIGWGEEEGVPYWLVANSWNSDWGDGGFFKIRKGTNECGFESMVTVGYAKTQ